MDFRADTFVRKYVGLFVCLCVHVVVPKPRDYLVLVHVYLLQLDLLGQMLERGGGYALPLLCKTAIDGLLPGLYLLARVLLNVVWGDFKAQREVYSLFFHLYLHLVDDGPLYPLCFGL